MLGHNFKGVSFLEGITSKFQKLKNVETPSVLLTFFSWSGALVLIADPKRQLEIVALGHCMSFNFYYF